MFHYMCNGKGEVYRKGGLVGEDGERMGEVVVVKASPLLFLMYG